jgi:hypothetical protein
MPRRKRTQLDHDFIYGRWKVFGEWLTLQRNNRGLTQYEAADWLLDETLNVLQERTKGKELDETQHRVKNLIWKKCGETLRSTMN